MSINVASTTHAARHAPGAADSLASSYAAQLAPTAVKTANYTAAASDLVPCDTTSGSFTVTLPNAPPDGTRVVVKHVIQGSANTVTVTCAGSDVFNKTGGTTSATLALLAQAIQVQYKASSHIWYVVADDLPLTQLDARYAALAETVQTIATSGSAQTLSLASGLVKDVTLTANCTFTMPTVVIGETFTVWLTQDVTGGRTATFTGAKCPGGSQIACTPTANALDGIAFTGKSIVGVPAWVGLVLGYDIR